MASAARRPTHHAIALQHWRQEACEDSDLTFRTPLEAIDVFSQEHF